MLAVEAEIKKNMAVAGFFEALTEILKKLLPLIVTEITNRKAR